MVGATNTAHTLNAAERRDRMMKILREAGKPVSGGVLSEQLGVSRQVIVQDVALLRAAGEDILATPQGYIIISSRREKYCQVFASRHDQYTMEEELLSIVQAGGVVQDVVVEHPLYGELRGNLMLRTARDVQLFMERFRTTGAEPLSTLTRGVHLHTVVTEEPQQMQRISDVLKEKGFLISEN